MCVSAMIRYIDKKRVSSVFFGILSSVGGSCSKW